MNTDIPGRWAITGAAGTVGRHLRSTLGAAFGELILLDTNSIEDAADNELVVHADLGELSALREALGGVVGVIHLAGLADEADFHDLAEVNIVGTYHLLEAARLNSVRRVVYASSNRATGCYPTTHLVRPDDPYRPDGLYGVTKAAAETLCRLYSDKFGMQIACVRIGSFEPTPTTPRELRTWLSPDDCTAAFRAAIEATYAYVTFYAVSDNTPSWWDLTAGSAIGFVPRDDANRFAASVTGKPIEPQGGAFATPEFTLSRQRHLLGPHT